MKADIAGLVQGVGNLVTLPDVFIRINQLVNDPDSNISDIAKAIGQDPSFTVRLLRVANSSFYGFASTIDTVPKAVSIIGTAQIRSLALATSVARSFEGLPNTLVSMENFWKHSLYCGLAARILARQVRGVDADAVFTAALLHDIGELVIFNKMPEKAKEALLLVLDSADEMPVYLAEQQVMGFDHGEVGAELARQWKLPPMIEECLGFHHNVRVHLRFPQEVAIVHIANILALMAEVQTQDIKDVPPIDSTAWEIIGLDAEDAIGETIKLAQEEFSEAKALFIGK